MTPVRFTRYTGSMLAVYALNLAYMALIVAAGSYRPVTIRVALAVASGLFAYYFLTVDEPSGWLWSSGFAVWFTLQSVLAFREERSRLRLP